MKSQGHQDRAGEQAGPSVLVYSVLVVCGMVAPAVTFLIAVSAIGADAKVYGLAATSAAYFAVCLWSLKRLRNAAKSADARGADDGENELTQKLLALEEANEFFGTSLHPADTFRLVSDRIRDLYCFDASVLFVTGGAVTGLRAVLSSGDNQAQFLGCEIDKGRGLAGLAMLSGEVEFSPGLAEDRTVLPASAIGEMTSSAAIPISFRGDAFGVLQLFSRKPIARDERSRSVLSAVSERIGPLLRGSIAREESLSSALTDPVTDLPNERAFFIVLENQLAESIRFRSERLLSILVFDIKSSESAAEPTGADKLLKFVAGVVSGQLRKMDFLARSDSDEFLVILPTAPRSVADEVLMRIQNSLAEKPFRFDGGEFKVRLNVGRACFWQDGETANQLLHTARLRMQQAKSQDPDKLLWFPKEYVN